MVFPESMLLLEHYAFPLQRPCQEGEYVREKVIILLLSNLFSDTCAKALFTFCGHKIKLNLWIPFVINLFQRVEVDIIDRCNVHSFEFFSILNGHIDALILIADSSYFCSVAQ